ncbi:hypothetical protein DAKH74_048460 [Maudiozyma humilis]|uniref:Uncharacterized protein n=1 Tax=Maudiozyma humilis TaxID=51915 RepID=A0AAV5S3E8_MAUHU|nr:hypothetical protein DAKH74_048460 [Kazachstania humilis]
MAVAQADVVSRSDDEGELIEIPKGSCDHVAPNGSISSNYNGCSSPTVIEIVDEETSSTFQESLTLEDVPLFGEYVESISLATEEPNYIPFGSGTSEPLPMVFLKHRSSNTLTSSERKVSKVMNSSKLSKKIAAITGTSKNVFALL